MTTLTRIRDPLLESVITPGVRRSTTAGDWVILAVIIAGVGAYVALGGDPAGLGGALFILNIVQHCRDAASRRAVEKFYHLPYWKSASYWLPVMVLVWLFSLPSILLIVCLVGMSWILAVSLRKSPARFSVGTVLRGPVIGEPGYLDIMAARYLFMMSAGFTLIYSSASLAGIPVKWGIPPLMEIFSWIVLAITG